MGYRHAAVQPVAKVVGPGSFEAASQAGMPISVIKAFLNSRRLCSARLKSAVIIAPFFLTYDIVNAAAIQSNNGFGITGSHWIAIS